LPASTIFVPGASASGAAPASGAASNGLAPVNQVIDARVGGALSLPDNTLQLLIPAGVADTDFVLVSLTEVGPTSASANLQVGTRRFVLSVIDSGGATVTHFGTSIVVNAGASGSLSVTALDPATGGFKTVRTDALPGQVTASLDTLAASATTGVADNSLTIARSTTSSSSLDSVGTSTNTGTDTGSSTAVGAQPQPARSGGNSSFDPSQILRNLGLMP
jgi:hypothetical protein